MKNREKTQILVEGNEGEFPLPASINQSLYKFFPDFEATNFSEQNINRLILKLEVRATSASEVNDPMDCNPAYIDDLDIKTFRSYFNYMRTLIPESQLQANLKSDMLNQFPTYKEIRKIRRVPKLWTNKFKQIIMRSFDSFGFVCFTEDPTNPLMWAHYANSHRGICVEFPTTPSFDTNLLEDLPLCSFAIKLNYEDIRPTISARENIPKTNADDLRKAILTKDRHWNYEKEWRVLGKYNAQSLLPAREFVSVGKDQPIASITFGLKSTREFRDRIIKLINRTSLNIKFKEAFLSDENYTIQIKNI